jgi:hypothetical protein
MCSCSVNHFFDCIIVSPWSFTFQRYEKEKECCFLLGFSLVVHLISFWYFLYFITDVLLLLFYFFIAGCRLPGDNWAGRS